MCIGASGTPATVGGSEELDATSTHQVATHLKHLRCQCGSNALNAHRQCRAAPTGKSTESFTATVSAALVGGEVACHYVLGRSARRSSSHRPCAERLALSCVAPSAARATSASTSELCAALVRAERSPVVEAMYYLSISEFRTSYHSRRRVRLLLAVLFVEREASTRALSIVFHGDIVTMRAA